MAKRGRDNNMAVQPVPTPTFFSLPDVAHAIISSFLPDGNGVGKDCRLRVSEASRALLETYGGNLNRISIHFTADASAGRLAALLRHQKHLEVILALEQEALPALSQVSLRVAVEG
jgi:hypothetical protein